MIKNVIHDAKAAVSLFGDMQKARKKGEEIVVERKIQVPFVVSGGFYNTVEGCTLSKLDKEIVSKAEDAFDGIPNEEKHKLQFSPKDGEFIQRAGLWRDILKPVMTEKQCHIAMKCIIEWYIHIKQMQLGNGGAV